MSDKALSFTQRSLAEALDNVRCLSDLGPELIAAQVFAASAQQPAQAVPDGWKLVPFHATREQVNAVFMHPDLARTLYRNMVEAAPAAPVAQEPVAWRVSEPSEPEIGHWLSEEPGTSWQRSEPLYTAPPAAEQPYSTTSDKYRAELYDEVWEKARAMGYGNVTMALAELERLKAAEQPDTVMLAEALKPFADAFEATGLPQYRGADDEHAEFLDENQITPVRGITMRQFRRAWEVLSGKSALLGKEGEA